MTETSTIDRLTPKTARPRSKGAKSASLPKRATVSASALAVHLDCSRTYLHKLEADGVIHRQGDGFPLDASRVAYLRHLRRERQRSPRSEADAAFQQAKTRLVMLRVLEREGKLMETAEAIATMDRIMGIVLTHLNSLPARIAGRDLAARRKIEEVIFQVRTEMSEAASKMADECGEPPEPEETAA